MRVPRAASPGASCGRPHLATACGAHVGRHVAGREGDDGETLLRELSLEAVSNAGGDETDAV